MEVVKRIARFEREGETIEWRTCNCSHSPPEPVKLVSVHDED